MRKRIGVFANGWGTDYLKQISKGMSEEALKADADLFTFVDFTVYRRNNPLFMGEFHVMRLPDMNDFDGIILATNSFSNEEEIEYLYQKIKAAGVPAVSLEVRLEGLSLIETDNYSGMVELVRHMLSEHNVKKLLFIGGTKEHPESQIRMRALLDTAREYNVDVSMTDIDFGVWTADCAVACLQKWMKSHGELPEAVICANDIMADGVVEWLQEEGYAVPGDVMVTGFDNIKEARELVPRLTTVSREWDKMGRLAMSHLLDRISGKAEPCEMSLKTRMVCGESCGCHEMKDEAVASPAKLYRSNSHQELKKDQHFRHQYRTIRKVESLEQLNSAFSYFFSHENWITGNYFMLCLHPEFFSSEDDHPFEILGYPKEMDVACSIQRLAPEKAFRIPSKEAIFYCANHNSKPANYLFVPIVSDDQSLGFAVMGRDMDIVDDNLLYIWTRHMNQNMEQIRSNVKIAQLTRRLEEMSVTDILTGVYNRTGCEKLIYPMLEKCQSEGGRGIVMLADIDNMKYINDRFGHANGDLALKIVASVLKHYLPEEFQVARFGGDEFLAGGILREDTADTDGMIQHVLETLDSKVKQERLGFPLTVSIGAVCMDSGEIFQPERCLQRADDNMYAMKHVHHQQD